MMKEKYKYPTVIQSIANIRDDLKIFAERTELPASELRQITLIVEELFSKIIRFAFQSEGNHFLELSLSIQDKEISIEMRDDGKAYNPIDDHSEQQYDPAFRDDGGMGLSLIKAFCDSIHYTREEHGNKLLIIKTIRGQAENHQT